MLVVGCTRSIQFPAAELQNLRMLAGANDGRGGEGLGERFVSGAGEAVGLVDPRAKVALRGEEVVLVDARTEMLMLVTGREDELVFQPGNLVFGPTDVMLNAAGTLRVPYERVAGLTLEKFSFGRMLLWTALVGGCLLLGLIILGLAVGGDGDGSHHHDFD